MKNALLALTLLLAGCSGLPTAPSDPVPQPLTVRGDFSYASEQEALGAFQGAWAAVEACSGFRASTDGLTLVLEPFSVDSVGAAGFQSPYGRVSGYWLVSAAEIHVLSDPAWSEPWKHEALHALLYRATGDGDVNHVSPLFVSCTR